MRKVRLFCVAIAVAVTGMLLAPAVPAQACMSCPCLNIKKDGPCLLR